MRITNIIPTPQEYNDLRLNTNMGSKQLSNISVALNNSLFVVSIWDENKLIGFGRIVGDGAITYVVSDIMVALDYQGKGIAKLIMKEIDGYFEKNTDSDAYIILLANKPANKLYEQFNFEDSQPKAIGMKRINK